MSSVQRFRPRGRAPTRRLGREPCERSSTVSATVSVQRLGTAFVIRSAAWNRGGDRVLGQRAAESTEAPGSSRPELLERLLESGLCWRRAGRGRRRWSWRPGVALVSLKSRAGTLSVGGWCFSMSRHEASCSPLPLPAEAPRSFSGEGHKFAAGVVGAPRHGAAVDRVVVSVRWALSPLVSRTPTFSFLG